MDPGGMGKNFKKRECDRKEGRVKSNGKREKMERGRKGGKEDERKR